MKALCDFGVYPLFIFIIKTHIWSLSRSISRKIRTKNQRLRPVFWRSSNRLIFFDINEFDGCPRNKYQNWFSSFYHSFTFLYSQSRQLSVKIGSAGEER